MIKYSLVCRDGHEFDAWFSSGAAYERQVAEALVSCPHCGSNKVEKAIMAPAVAKRTTGKSASEARPSPTTASVPPHEMLSLMRRIRDEIRAKSEYVGDRFAEEARRIHFDESPPRSIHGEASADEARALAEDGIPFLPVPRLIEDLN